MKYECGMIRDLLPLYQDRVCSEESRRIVQEHLEECQDCRKISEKLANETYDNRLQQEKEDIIGKHVRQEKRRSLLAGCTIAGILMIPVVVCLICNIAIGHSLDWFFIVLTSLMVLASVTVVPLVAEVKKGLFTIISFTVSLLLLLLVTCIYSGGTWFPITALAVIFGLSVVFLPYVAYQLPLRGTLAGHRGLAVMLIDTVLLYELILLCGGHFRPAILITSFCLLLPWGIFLTIRYLKTDKLTKTGICIIIAGIYMGIINDVIDWICGNDRINSGTLKNADLLDWSRWETIDGNIFLMLIVISVVAGGVLILAGKLKKKK